MAGRVAGHSRPDVATMGNSMALAAVALLSVLCCVHAPCSDGDSMTTTECIFFQTLGLCETAFCPTCS